MDVSIVSVGAVVSKLRALSPALALALSQCLGEGARPPAGQLQVSVAPLQLEGITDAQYTIVVTNAPDGAGEVVWQQTVTSDRYGDGAGSITYIGTCDASAGTHTVKLTLDSLTDANGTVDPTTYVNPTPLSLEPTCLENADVPVLFDITLMRSADQGFFDVSVQFEDIFCSAKLDCQNPDATDLDLLFNGLNRDMTAVLGFACTGGLGGDTYLYMDDLVIDCTNSVTDVRVEPTGRGLVTPTSNPNVYLFGAAIYRGVEANGIMYWNAALGLNAAAFGAMGDCTLKTRATASSTPWPQLPGGFPLPEATVYPVIEWDVQLSNATQRVCTQHEVNGGNGVATNYLGYLPLGNGFTWANAIIYMRHRLAELLGGATQVLSAGAPVCNPSCAHGGCVDPGTGPVCDCAGTGYSGPACAAPVCTSPCQNGGDCVAPDTCDCTGTGYDGPTCESDIDECQTANGGCSADATCTNTEGGLTCECDPGFYGDGVTCAACPAGAVQPLGGQTSCDACPIGTFDDGDETCATCATCNPGQQVATACTATNDAICGVCPPGTYGNGLTCTACAAGEVQPDAGSDTCVACGPGTYDDGDETCAACAAGSVQPVSGQTACTACGAGTFDDGDETCATCATCLAGQQVVSACGVTTDTICGTCPAGTSGDGLTCTACPAGQVQPDAGSASCTTCGAGTYDDGDEICGTCATCSAGNYETGACTATTNRTCGTCASVSMCTGTVTCTTGTNSVCSQCATGYTQASAGAACTDIDECAANTDNCHPNATCTNSAGAFTCTCLGGAAYGDGLSCTYPTSCLALRQSGLTTSGAYWIDPDGAGAVQAQQVWCDLVTDGGGYTFLKASPGSAYTAAQAETFCASRGMQLFIPRTSAHLASAWQVANSATFGPDAGAGYLGILGIYPKTAGATCANTALRSGNASCNWEAGDGGQFWVSALTTVPEPNGTNSLDGSMSYTFDGAGNATSWSDTPAPGATSARFMCDVGDKDGTPASCLAWLELGHTASTSYVIDPDGVGPNPAVTVNCDMSNAGGGWTQLNASLVTLQVNKGTASWSGSDIVGTGAGTNCGVNPRQYTLASPKLTYGEVYVLLTRTTTILQCSSIGHSGSGWYTPPYAGSFTSNGMCTWGDGVFANACCGTAISGGLKLNWALTKTGVNTPLYYDTQCSADTDNGAFTMKWFVR